MLFACAHARLELEMECAPDVGVGARGSVAGNVTVTVMDTLMRHHSHCTACDPAQPCNVAWCLMRMVNTIIGQGAYLRLLLSPCKNHLILSPSHFKNLL